MPITNASARLADSARFRLHQKNTFALRVWGRARIGRPFCQRSKSSANASAVGYRECGILLNAVNAIVERLTLDPRGIGATNPRAWRVVNALVALTLDGNGGKAAPKAWQVEVRLRGSAQAFVLEFIVGGWRLAGVSG